MGAFEGADRLGREMATFRPRIQTADAILGRNDKILLDARGHDMLRNHGPMLGAMRFHQDSIVGHQYRLNATPRWRYLGLSEEWAEDFQLEVEEAFNLYAESDECWADVEGTKTLTDIVRLAVCCFFAGGEVVGTMNWMPGSTRPYASAMQLIDADRLSNPHDLEDTSTMRRGVELDKNGRAIALHIRRAHPRDNTAGARTYEWQRWPLRLRFGRLNGLHILDQIRPAQHRGISEMVSVMKETRMGKRFHEVALANAIAQASFAAAIESELPPDVISAAMGATPGGLTGENPLVGFLESLAAYSRGGGNIAIDGSKIPILHPNTKLKLLPAGTPGGIGEKLEESFNRHVSTALKVSYEEYTNDYSKTNYSSAKASSNNTLKAMQARKRKVADRTANAIYGNWLEEAITEGRLESTRQMTRRDSEWFYRGMNRQALTQASWIGASRGQVDEVKETNAAIARIEAGLSTVEDETARLGKDWRDVAAQRSRERKVFATYGLPEPSTKTVSAGTVGNEENDAEGQQPKDTQEEDDGFDD